MKGIKLLLSILFTSILLITSHAFSCTRILHIDPTYGVLVGRNMDWYEEMQTKLVVYPRGIARDGYAKVNPLKWVSRYGSIVATSYDLGSADGMNEKGLAMHGLWLDATDFGKRNEKIPGVSLLMVMHYYLDNFKSVDDVLRNTNQSAFQIIPYFHPQTHRWIKVHIALEDASGDSAIIEFINGAPKIYHSKSYKTLTNDPVFPDQLNNLKNYQGFGGKKPLPGTYDATDRFVRATYYEARLPNADSYREAVAGVISVLQNTSPPFTSVENNMYVRTIWRTVSDLSHHIYYFISTPNFTTVYASLDKFNLKPGAPVMKLDLVKRPNLSGDMTEEFEPVV